MHSITGVRSEALQNSPVAIIYLDLNSFAELKQNPTLSWPRELHAKLLQKLSAAGARAVVFDIVFSQAGPNAAADAAFTEALRANGHVILAAEYANTTIAPSREQSSFRMGTVQSIYPRFASAAAGVGIASQKIEEDNLVRHYLAGFPHANDSTPSLTWAAASHVRLPVTQAAAAMQMANQHWVRYYGPPLSIPHDSYSRALTETAAAKSFKGKIVFVGARPSVDLFNAHKDQFRSPFHSEDYKEFFMPGVEVHATEMLNLIRGDWLARLAPGFEAAILIFAGLLFGSGLVWLRPIPATVVSCAGSGLCLAAGLASFAHGVWFPWLIISGAQIPTALGGAFLYYSIEWFRARRRFEAARRIAEEKIREQAALIDKANDAILVESLTGWIEYANPSAERLYGWTLAQLLVAKAGTKSFALEPIAAEQARQTSLESNEWSGELRQQNRAGKEIIVASRWTLIRDQSGQPQALLVINTDITEKKILEAQFLRTQRLNTIGMLAGGMAHDLNNALAPILMGAQLLRRKAADDESRQMLLLIETNTYRSADMVRQVLLLARGKDGDLEQIQVGPIVKEVEKIARETFPKTIKMESFLPGDLWPVHGNPTQLYQVLLNLSVNARDAMPEGGKLTFILDNVDLSTEEAGKIQDAKPGHYVSLLVSDTGTGMTPEVQAKIFEPFFTTKAEGQGTGIGLATVMRIVKAHSGFIRLESEPGRGTSFEVFLPRSTALPKATAALDSLAQLRGKGEIILLADAEEAIRNIMSTELKAAGYEVITAANGAEAVQYFRENARRVRLFITDNPMPFVGGLSAIRILREQNATLPIILTGAEPG
ncbi:MAG TPA: CHASE2 domain-containing protein, partial [Verrucomicrobiae bacterium]